MIHAFDVMVAGELYVDMIMSGFEFWPQPGREAFAQAYRREIGGGAAITACGLAKLGSRTSVLAVAGYDSGDWIIDRLKHNRVDTSRIRLDANEPTGFTVVATSPEDRAFLTYAGANRNFPAALMDAAMTKEISGARHIHLGFAPCLDTADALFDAIWESGCTVSLDAGWHQSWLKDPRAMALLAKIDIFFPNEVEAHAMTGEDDPLNALQAFAAAGIERVALKLGCRGAALLWQGDIWFATGRTVTLLDTTGAGDCFDAGFLHAWLKGEPPEICLLTGNICGANSTEGYGGLSGFPTADHVAQELSRGPSCVRWP